MRQKKNITQSIRIKNCSICGTHASKLYSRLLLCRQCYHGLRVGQAVAVAIEQQRLANVTD